MAGVHRLDGFIAKSNRQTLQEHTEQVVRYVQHLTTHPAAETAAQWHDLGKTADWFQRAMRGEPVEGWYRHEILSALAYLYHCRTQQTEPDDDILLAVLTHHKDLDQLAVYIYADAALEFCSQLPEDVVPSSEIPTLLEDLRARYRKLIYSTPQGIAARAVSLRGSLIAADHAASAGLERPLQVDKPFHLPQPRPFQQDSARRDNVLLIAQTGSGKTEAALLWYEAARDTYNRLIYLLPYRASAEAMRQRLVRIWGDDLVGIVHARDIQYAYQRYLSEYDERTAESLAKRDANLNRLVHKQVIISTPYQLLNYLLGVKRFEVGTELMHHASVVFDEIHSYDADTIAQLLVLLEVLQQLGSRVMIMSATLPNWLRELIGEHIKCHAIESPPVFPARHRLRLLDRSLEEAIPLIRRDLADGKRVLVVCNRIGQAQEIYQQFSDFPPRRLLHSRFTYRDRGAIEREILNRSTQPQLLVATQVVEVSLDISYDTCYTEVAPVDDLLQRFGRVNRRGEMGVADVYVCLRYDRDRVRYVYDLDLLSRTSDALSECELDYDTERTLLEQAYSHYGWSDRHQARYELFRLHVSQLRAGYSTRIEMDEGIDEEVIPVEHYEEYCRLIDSGRYLAARELLVPVRTLPSRFCSRTKYGWLAERAVYDEYGLQVKP